MELVSQDKNLAKQFYLTGGTALSEFYLHHRLSVDLDFFSESEFEILPIEIFFQSHSNELDIKQTERVQFLGLQTFQFTFSDDTTLKIDFNYYPFPRIEKGTTFNQLAIDSPRDIAANKVHTIYMKARERDFVDLYFLMKQYNFNLKQLILDAKLKFDWHIDQFKLAETLLKSQDYSTLPKMLVPFDPKEMNTFFQEIVRSLEKNILE